MLVRLSEHSDKDSGSDTPRLVVESRVAYHSNLLAQTQGWTLSKIKLVRSLG